VTLENIVEELVGTIRDELEDEEPVRVSGALPRDRIRKGIGREVKLPQGYYVTYPSKRVQTKTVSSSRARVIAVLLLVPRRFAPRASGPQGRRWSGERAT